MDTKKMDLALRRLVEDGSLPMASAIVLQHGNEVYRGFYGMRDIEAGLPVQDDTLYRIFSMTKVVTATAMMQLYEQGMFHLDDPVYDFLPGFADQQVLRVLPDGSEVLEAAARPNTVRDLLRMTSGIPYYHAGRTPVADRMHTIYEIIDNSPYTDHPITTVEAANMIGRNPLEFHPGTGFQYGLGIDVIGALIEIISGRRLGDYCRENILEPLGMQDTGFFVPPEKQNRLSRFYRSTARGVFEDGTTRKDDRQLSRPVFEEGGDGIVTTTRDYARFAQMLLQKGRWQNEHILGRKTVEFMSQNHLTPAQAAQAARDMDTMRGYGYGLGVRVMIDPTAADIPGSLGEWGWYGKGGSWFCVDPKEDLVIVFHTQDGTPGQVRHKSRFVAAVYAALD